MANGDDEVSSHEKVDLAELHRLRFVQVARRPQHHEEHLAVALELGPLIGLDRVLDRQLVQVKLVGDQTELLLRRFAEIDTGETASRAAGTPGLLQRRRLRPVPVGVDCATDDYRRTLYSGWDGKTVTGAGREPCRRSIKRRP